MGKTLKRERAKLAAAAAAAPAHHKKQKGAEPPPPPPPKSASAWTAAASSALERREWGEACALLSAMRRAGRSPKLGAIQRWVRDADAAGDEGTAARVICGVLRAAEAAAAEEGAAAAAAGSGGGDNRAEQAAQEEAAAAAAAPGAAVIRHAPWSPPLSSPSPPPETAEEEEAAPLPPLPKFVRVPRAPGAGGADSFVGGAAPVPICAYPPGTAVTWDPDGAEEEGKEGGGNSGNGDGNGDGNGVVRRPPSAARPPVVRADVPFVPGAFVLVGALSPRECHQVLRAGRALGFSREVDYAFGGGASAAAAAPLGGAPDNSADNAGAAGQSAARRAAAAAAGLPSAEGRPAEGCVWLADSTVLDPLWRRVRHLLPQHLGGGALAGINSRWRLYRYSPGAVFRPHVDGAWPASGLDAQGRYLFDAHGGEVWSRLTFLVYLNSSRDEGEEGGEEKDDGDDGDGDGDDGNDDGRARPFAGGATTFFSPALDGSPRLHARGVRPEAGSVLVFPHGDAAGALVHEGSAVSRGAKYVVRTEVLYALPPRDDGAGGRRRVSGGVGGGPVRRAPEAAAGLGLSLPTGGAGGGR